MAVDPIVSAFREALGRGELLVQRCEDCGKLNMYPRHACPFCQSFRLGWAKSEGRGTLISYTVLRFGAPEGFEHELPYALGIVRLDEGVQLLCRLEPDADGGWNHFACDQPVAFVAKPAEEVQRRPCAWFGPAAGTGH
jgi:uncharacterized OB-fold protein